MRFLPFIILLFSINVFSTMSGRAAHAKIPAPKYYHLRGKIDGKYSVTMELSLYKERNGIRCSGSYYYDAVKEPIPFSFGTFENDSIDIFPEVNLHSEEFTGFFDGRRFSGVWYQYKKGYPKECKGLSFVALVDTTENLQLKNFAATDSCKVGKDLVSWFTYDLLFSGKSENEKLDELLCQMYGGVNSQSDIRKKMVNDSKDFFGRFKGISPNAPSWEVGEWEVFHRAKVVYNSKEIVTIMYTSCANEGMVHAGVWDEYHSYSLDDQKEILLSDFIDPGDSIMLNRVLIKYLRLNKWLREDFMAPTPAFNPKDCYVTSKGVALLWSVPPLFGGNCLVPIFIPFSEFGDKLKKQSWMEL